ncbi:UDP-N-acetyl-D-mannosamine transferase [Labrys miyagiensis]|uniref:UDP-N-acetyl-D-mannosamine transferase n=1 Tax=Labrys miyagiensis TaxID=346912 RepID=A0ABQ6CM40_9HYPH|nr:WecB/TagA/CpsF family glycosyltransferase [Labrys miyagiensis]GLS19930.1 UDP-N-acetyl-D-mannosamine transferase [Labrys miyagiensis]
MESLNTVLVGGVATARLSREDMANLMLRDCLAARSGASTPKLVFDVNGHALALAFWNRDFRRDLAAGDLVHADGQAIVAASRFLTSAPIPERSATTDFFHDAAALASRAGLRFFLLGATEEVNALCEARMRALYPDLQIVGRRNGYFAQGEEAAICEAINASGADIVWIGLGKPNEQAFCVRNRGRLKAGWLVTCGGCFNYVAGNYPRAPRWMQSAGLEWLHRLLTNPRKLFWRYVTTNPVAIYLLLTQTSSRPRGAGA